MKRRVVLPMAGTLAETDHVLGHELVHAFQYDIAAQRASQGGNQRRHQRRGKPCLWFIEGMAEYLSIGPVDPHTAMWIRDAARKDKLPTIADLDNPKYFPYRWGQALWAFIGGRWGDEAIPRIYRGCAAFGRHRHRAEERHRVQGQGAVCRMAYGDSRTVRSDLPGECPR